MGKRVIIIGGGLAGLTAAIHLARTKVAVTLIEKNGFPKHKVCGEYISNEVLPYFESLGIDLSPLHPVAISKTAISTANGKLLTADLPLGGFSISRYTLDGALMRHAKRNGCEIIQGKVTDVNFKDDVFNVTTEVASYQGEIVLGAFGKRANLDLKWKRGFLSKPAHWLAVKAHYEGDFPEGVVALHNFKGGYCGVSKVETGAINLCYLADVNVFRKCRDIDDFQRKVVAGNPHLRQILDASKPLFKPISISQISFEQKSPVENHLLMIGDTAGLIHPLCGNGMAMAVHSAKIASELIIDYMDGKIPSRKALENAYVLQWNAAFRSRLRTGRWLAGILRSEKLSAIVMQILTRFPVLLSGIIRKTHGKPLPSAK